MSRTLVSAYAASLARVGSWVIVLGLVFRTSGGAGHANLGLLALARATVGLLGYASLGLTPVLVRLLTRNADNDDEASRAYATAGVMMAVTALLGVAGLCLWIAFGLAGTVGPGVADGAASVFLTIGLGTLVRAASDWFASALLAAGRIVTDSGCQVAAEIAFVLATVVALAISHRPVVAAGIGFLASSVLLLVVRGVLASGVRRPRWSSFDPSLVPTILLLGFGVLAGQMADWLYAPFNQILINRHLGKEAVAAYAVALQIDGGLLLAVGGLAAVMLPASALAFRDGRFDELRKQYVRAWLASAGILAGVSIIVWSLSSLIFSAWLGDTMLQARAILPWVLLHTTIGGTAAVGRSVLLGVGRVRAYTLSAVLGGVANAGLATWVVTQTSLGLRGVVLATVLTVAVRCGLWMPWYTRRCLRPPVASSI